MKQCPACLQNNKEDSIFCAQCGERLPVTPPLSSDPGLFMVSFTWPKSWVWSVGGLMLIRVDRQEVPFELKNGKSINIPLLAGAHHFSCCAKGFKKGVDFEYVLNKHTCFICKPSKEAVLWGASTSAPAVTVTQEIHTEG